jgi:hypothetical protein
VAEREESSLPNEEIQSIKNAAVRGAKIVRQLNGSEESPSFEPIDFSLLVDEML